MKQFAKLGTYFLILLFLSACAKGKKNQDGELLTLLSLLQIPKGISVEFSGGSSASQNQRSNESNESNRVQAMYFGQLRIYAHSYQPEKGKELYSVSINKPGEAKPVLNWTTAVILDEVFNSAGNSVKDNLIQNSEVVNIESWMDPSILKYVNSRFQTYLNEVTNYKIDFLELNIYRAGLILDNVFFNYVTGTQNETKNYLYKYPEYSSLPMTAFQSSAAGGLLFCDACDTDLASASVILLARREHIDSTLFVKMNFRDYVTWDYDLEYSRTVSDKERNIIESLVKHQRIVHYGRGFLRLIVIPADLPVVSRDGSGISPEDLAIRIKFDLTKVVDFDPSKTDLSIPKITFARDANSVPMGLSVEVIDKSKK
ncbi:hypothetical protein [Leptospira adleri]|uniref:hypothetical protein n=1 Tax=Leptospira adleri TaxID=2023186 RepID=UPI00108443DB|nr:hypothetical protein [Leptospira adleri]TGM57819.1 hypothetical protein EHQ97_09025 [Leptospira adleri]